MIDFSKKDELFIGDEILREFWDCCDCGLCCKYFENLPFYKEEAKEIAEYLKISEYNFYKKYTKSGNYNKSQEISLKSPCPFLKNNYCSIYEHRGFICRTFPLCINLTTNRAVLSGIYFCPQATQFYEGLLYFLEKFHYKQFNDLLIKEKELEISENGFEIQGVATIFSEYLDWLYKIK